LQLITLQHAEPTRVIRTWHIYYNVHANRI